jgi:hypothetical protein
MFSRTYRNCDVRMGRAEGVGYVSFGSNGTVTTPTNLEFSISVLGRSDAHYGKLDKMQIETSDYMCYTITLNWTNARTVLEHLFLKLL